jgi:uncharacterized protein YdeI (YjbR/CyaY-like superfamily)
MATRRTSAKPTYFATPEAFRTWLDRNSASVNELLVGFRKVGSGKPSITWPQSVDEALCVGWIDGVRKRIDDTAYTIRFTPRKPGSIWSAINIAKVNELIAAGRMRAAGLAAFERRTERRSRIYAYEKPETALAPDELTRFRRERNAWAFFEKCPPGYRKVMLYWITSAKRPETRLTRFDKLIATCAAGKRLR